MTIEEKVYALLAAAVPVTSLVPVARILLPGDHQKVPTPYIVHFPATDQDVMQLHTGTADLDIWPFYQISCFSTSYSTVCTLAAAIRAAIEGVHDGVEFLYEGRHPMFEPDTLIHQMVLSFRVAEAL